jgi:transcriptional regulator with XRE-family HTH domain
MNEPRRVRELSYEARARIADNLFLQRKRAGYSQIALGERAMVTPERISAIETGKPNAMLDTYVRIAGALSITLDDLLAGVIWTPAILELEYDPGYEVELEVEVQDEAGS